MCWASSSCFLSSLLPPCGCYPSEIHSTCRIEADLQELCQAHDPFITLSAFPYKVCKIQTQAQALSECFWVIVEHKSMLSWCARSSWTKNKQEYCAHLGIRRIDTELTGVLSSARTVRRLFTCNVRETSQCYVLSVYFIILIQTDCNPDGSRVRIGNSQAGVQQCYEGYPYIQARGYDLVPISSPLPPCRRKILPSKTKQTLMQRD